MDFLAVYITLFVMLQSSNAYIISALRNRHPLMSSDVIDFVKHVKGFRWFYDEELMSYSESYIIKTETVASSFDEVYRILNELNIILANHMYNYFVNSLHYFCNVSIALLELISNEPNKTPEDLNKALNNIQFKKCMFDSDAIYILFSLGYWIQPIVNAFYYFHTYLLDGRRQLINIDFLIEDLKVLKDSLNILYNPGNKKKAIKKITLPYILNYTKAKYNYKKNFSRLCNHLLTSYEMMSDTTKISDEKLFFKKYLELNNVVKNRQSQFIEYVVEKEVCKIQFNNSFENFKRPFLRIQKWSCLDILDSPEYGLEDYKKSIQAIPNTADKAESSSASKSKNVVTGKQELEPANSITTPIEFRPTIQENYSLTSLKKSLEINYYHYNIVVFYNIAVDMIIMEAKKEGFKLIKGIKYNLQIKYKNEKHKSNQEIFFMRSQLTTFYLLFDRLIHRVLNELEIKIMDELYSIFKSVMVSFIEYLSSPEKVSTSNAYFNNILVDSNIIYAENTIAYNEYHFVSPITNIIELYKFTKLNF